MRPGDCGRRRDGHGFGGGCFFFFFFFALAEREIISAAGASSWSALSSPKGVRWLLLLWLAGALLVLARLLVGIVGLTWRAHAAKRLTGEYWDVLMRELSAQIGLTRRVTLMQSGTALMPMTWGGVSPVVLLPENAGNGRKKGSGWSYYMNSHT
jgi:hypothetical protein